jgi:cytohesin
LNAAIEGDAEAVKRSLDAGADINVQNVKGSQSWTPLFGAVVYGRREVIELLIAKGADVNRKCEDY